MIITAEEAEALDACAFGFHGDKCPHKRQCRQCHTPITDADPFCSDQCEVAFDRQTGPNSDDYHTDVAATPKDKEDR